MQSTTSEDLRKVFFAVIHAEMMQDLRRAKTVEEIRRCIHAGQGAEAVVRHMEPELLRAALAVELQTLEQRERRAPAPRPRQPRPLPRNPGTGRRGA